MKSMTDNRVSPGVPTGGQFSAQNRTESSAFLPRERRTITVFDLEVGDVIISASGARLTVDNVEASSLMPGSFAIENDFGTLYLPAEDEVTVAGDGEKSWTIVRGEPINHEALTSVLSDSQGSGLISGVIYTRDTVESQIFQFAERGGNFFADDEAFAIENKLTDGSFIPDVFEVVQESHGWGQLGDGLHEDDEILESEVARAIQIVIARP
jgi:hypothetical protein